MHRAFASWAANSPRINFFDVTAKCAAWHDEANAGAAIPTTFNQCPYAEIWVTWMDVRTGAASTNNEVVSLNRRVRHLEATIPADRMVEAGVSIIESRGGVQAANEAAGAGTAALANPYPSYTSAFRFTNGNINHGDVYATTRATISFNPALCWYLDSTFCSSFHTVKATMGADAANALFSALVFSCFALGAFIFFLHFLQIAQRVLSEGFVGAAHSWKNRQTRKRFMMAVMAALKQQPMWLWGLKLTLLVCPITFYAQVLLPCFNCYDFEAAATHEIGHVLGLSHPDTDFEASLCGSSYCTQPGVNSYNVMLAAGRTWNSTTCGQPWAGVAAFDADAYVAEYHPGARREGNGAYVDAGGEVVLDHTGHRPSIMKALTQNNPRVCLSDDDLEALNTLYPDCESMVTTPVCFKVQHNIGWVRLFVWTLCPVLIILAAILVLSRFVQNFALRRLDSAMAIAMEQKRTIEERDREIRALSATIVQVQQQNREQQEGREQLHRQQQQRPLFAFLRSDLC